MSAMSFSENNEALWRGVRPAHRGAQISKDGYAVNAIVDVYQVPSGEKACINVIVLSLSGGFEGNVKLFHTQSNNTEIAQICFIMYKPADAFPPAVFIFPEPLELTDQEKIRVLSTETGCYARVYVKGRHE